MLLGIVSALSFALAVMLCIVTGGFETFLFLWLLSEPMLKTLDRIKTKYGFYRA